MRGRGSPRVCAVTLASGSEVPFRMLTCVALVEPMHAPQMSLSLDREKEANTALHTRRRLSSKTYDAAAASVQHQMAPRRTLLPVLSLVVIFGLLGLLLVLGDRRVIAGSGEYYQADDLNL